MAWWVELLNEAKGHTVLIQPGIRYVCGEETVLVDVEELAAGEDCSVADTEGDARGVAFGCADGLWGIFPDLRIHKVIVVIGTTEYPVLIPPRPWRAYLRSIN